MQLFKGPHLYKVMKKNFTILIEKDEEGWLVSSVVELPGCHTQAKSMDELIERTKDAISLYVEVEGIEIKDNFLGIQKIEV